MIFKQFFLESLGQASYLVGSEQTGEALVLDPRRDVDIYFEEARRHGLQIKVVGDTHQHNDYLTGACELSSRTNLEILGGSLAELKYPFRPMADGSRVELGELVFEIRHTPGHTPEHISLVLTDRSRGEEPALLLSGGSLLVGDIARPDLLGGQDQTHTLAKAFYHTLKEKILVLPDFVEVYPTHVAGSLCGGQIGSRLSTTIGYERKMNKVLKELSTENNFVEAAIDLKNLPAIPPYWPRIRKLNQEGPPLLGSLPEPQPFKASTFETLMHQGAVVVDCRAPEAFAVHIPGAQNVGFGPSFPIWAGSFLPEEKEILLVLDSPQDLWKVSWELLRIGCKLPKGWLAGGMAAWRTAGKELVALPQWTVWDLQQCASKEKNLLILDVRQPRERNSGHIAQSRHVSAAYVPKEFGNLPQDKTIAVTCASGYRSSVVASFLQSKGYPHVVNVIGGMSAWRNAGFPVVF